MKPNDLIIVGAFLLIFGLSLLPIVGEDITITAWLRGLPMVVWIGVAFFLGHVLWPS